MATSTYSLITAADRNVGPRGQLVGAGAQDRLHRLVEPGQRPALGELAGDQRVQLLAAGVDAAHEIVEEIDLGFGIFDIVDGGAEPVVMEFVQQRRERRPLHLLLVERLHGGEPGGGAGERAFRGGGHGGRCS